MKAHLRIKIISFSFFFFFFFLLYCPNASFAPDSKSLYIFSPYSNYQINSMIHYRIICSDDYLNTNLDLLMVNNNFKFQKKIKLLSPLENLYQDVSKFPSGAYQCYFSLGDNRQQPASNILNFTISTDKPSLSLKGWLSNQVKKVSARNFLLEAETKEKLQQVSILIDQHILQMENYGFTWKWNGYLPLKKGMNEVVLMGTNYHDVTSKILYKIELDDKKLTKSIPVLVYHNIGYMNGSFNVTPDVFDQQMKELLKQGCYFADPEEISLFYQNQLDLPEKTVLLTFDDGYKGMLYYALPILKKYHIKATMFVVTSFIGSKSMLTWDQLDEIMSSKLISLGSHTHNLHFFQRIPPFQINYPAMLRLKIMGESFDRYQERILKDLQLSRKILEEKYNNKIISFAYPFGSWNNEALRTVKAADFKIAFGYDSKQAKQLTRNSNQFLLERYPIFQYSTLSDIFVEEK